jgi:hypothetical protein
MRPDIKQLGVRLAIVRGLHPVAVNIAFRLGLLLLA